MDPAVVNHDTIYQFTLTLEAILMWLGGAAAIIAAMGTYIYNKDWTKQEKLNDEFSTMHKIHTELGANLDRNLAVLQEVVNRKIDRVA